MAMVIKYIAIFLLSTKFICCFEKFERNKFTNLYLYSNITQFLILNTYMRTVYFPLAAEVTHYLPQTHKRRYMDLNITTWTLHLAVILKQNPTFSPNHGHSHYCSTTLKKRGLHPNAHTGEKGAPSPLTIPPGCGRAKSDEGDCISPSLGMGAGTKPGLALCRFSERDACLQDKSAASGSAPLQLGVWVCAEACLLIDPSMSLVLDLSFGTRAGIIDLNHRGGSRYGRRGLWQHGGCSFHNRISGSLPVFLFLILFLFLN